jgi:Fe-S-cluster containining protein
MASEKTRQLEELYATIPKVICRRQCAECCSAVIWTKAEWERIPEAKRKNTTTIRCPYVTEFMDCEVYEQRPLMCRLFGVIERMRCPYREPEKMMTREEEDHALKTYAEICNR